MVSSIGQSSTLQSFTAINAFRGSATKPESKPEVLQESQTQETEEEINVLGADNLLEKLDVKELRKCAMAVGEYSITDEDIKYGLTYGRSVIAEFIA